MIFPEWWILYILLDFQFLFFWYQIVSVLDTSTSQIQRNSGDDQELDEEYSVKYWVPDLKIAQQPAKSALGGYVQVLALIGRMMGTSQELAAQKIHIFVDENNWPLAVGA